MQNLVYEWVDFSKFSQIWANKFKKLFEKIGWFCFKFRPKSGQLVNEWVTFLEKLVFVWVYFQIPRRHVPTKTKLECPPGPKFDFSALLKNRTWWFESTYTNNTYSNKLRKEELKSNYSSGTKFVLMNSYIYLLIYSFLFTNPGRPFNAQHCSPMVPLAWRVKCAATSAM